MRDEDPIRVFISSKQAEFKPQRRLMQELIEETPHLAAVTAEDFSPETATVQSRYLGDVRRCEIFVGLYGCVYSAPTEEEYHEAAKNSSRQLLLYVNPCKSTRDEKLETFVQEIQQKHVVVTLGSARRIRDTFIRDVNQACKRMLKALLDQSQEPKTQGGANTMRIEEWRRARAELSEFGYAVGERPEIARVTAKLRAISLHLDRLEKRPVVLRWLGM